MISSLCHCITLTLLAAFVAGLGGVCHAQQTNLELLELKTTLDASARRIGELEATNGVLKAQVSALTQSLSSANNQTAQIRESYEKLRGLLEGLGVGALEGNADVVRERLVSAMSDMRLLEEQKKKLVENLVNLSEAGLAYAKTASNPDASIGKRMEEALGNAETAIRQANNTGTNDGPTVDLHNAKVLSVKPELGVGVLNVGAKDGVRVGMPFQVVREDRSIAKVLVVDVRKSIAGVVIQEVLNSKDPIKVGDRGIVDAERSF